MKVINIPQRVIILIIILISSYALSAQENDNTRCKEYHNKSLEFMNEYYYSGYINKNYLDSAQVCLDYVIYNCVHNDMAIIHKLQLLSYKREYTIALQLIKSNKWEIDNTYNPHFLNILRKRFEAMQLYYIGDTLSCNDTIKSIVKELDNFRIDNSQTIDSLLRLSHEEIIKSPLSFSIFQYYYYKFKLYTPKEIIKELVQLEQLGVNKDIIDLLTPQEDDIFLNYSVY